jgi:hypothetical protein
LVAVYYRSDADPLHLPQAFAEVHPPQMPITYQGRKYLTDAYNTHPTNGTSIAFLWLLRDGVALPVAGLGQANDWKLFNDAVHLAQTNPFRARLPARADWTKDRILFAWSDLNGDGQVQPEEVTFVKGEVGSVTVMPDLSLVTGMAVLFQPQGFTAQGAPIYKASTGRTLVPGARAARTTGGGQVLVGKNGWTVLTVPPEPYPPQSSMAGARAGQPMWTYPSLWPGLHPSHNAPMPDHPGQLIGTTRLLGTTITPRGAEAVELWAINGNKGNVYLFTTDGLFVATLFRDCRAQSWQMPVAERGMRLNEVSLGEESFWPSITQTRAGDVYMVVDWPSIVRVEGLETIRRLADGVVMCPVRPSSHPSSAYSR